MGKSHGTHGQLKISFLLDLFKIMGKNAKGSGAKLLTGIEPKWFAWIALAALAGIVFFSFAAKKNERIEKLNEARHIWMPDKTETDYIEKRFDNTAFKMIEILREFKHYEDDEFADDIKIEVIRGDKREIIE